MKPLGYIFIGCFIGALTCGIFIYSKFGHYRDSEQSRNEGYLDAQHDILVELEKHFGVEGKFPGSANQEVQPAREYERIFGLKTSEVMRAEKNGVPTLYIYP